MTAFMSVRSASLAAAQPVLQVEHPHGEGRHPAVVARQHRVLAGQEVGDQLQVVLVALRVAVGQEGQHLARDSAMAASWVAAISWARAWSSAPAMIWAVTARAHRTRLATGSGRVRRTRSMTRPTPPEYRCGTPSAPQPRWRSRALTRAATCSSCACRATSAAAARPLARAWSGWSTTSRMRKPEVVGVGLGPLEALVVGAAGLGAAPPAHVQRVADAVVEEVGRAAPVGGDGGQPAGHGLQHRHAPALAPGGQHEAVGRAVERRPSGSRRTPGSPSPRCGAEGAGRGAAISAARRPTGRG